MFLCQPLLEVLAGRGIEDIDAFLKVPSWNDLPVCPAFVDSGDRVVGVYACALARRAMPSLESCRPLCGGDRAM
jgi:hypothetical protein